MNEAVFLAMLQNPENAAQIAEWAESEEGKKMLAESESEEQSEDDDR